MRIGIDIRPLMEGKITGVEVYTINLLQNLFKLDQKNSYLLFSNSFKPATMPNFDFPNVTIKNFRYPNKLFNFSLKFLDWPKIDRLLNGLDIFFSPRYLFTALSPDCRLVVTVHDLSFVINPEFFSLKGRLWHWLVSDKKAARIATKVIAVSDSTKNDLIKHFRIDSKKIAVIHSGVNTQTYNPEVPDKLLREAKTIYNLPDEFILYLGTIEPRKNIEGIIQAYEILRKKLSQNPSPQAWGDVPKGQRGRIVQPALVLAGGLGWSYKGIMEMINNSPYRASIRYLGAVEEKLKAPLYRLAKMLVFPSFYEGFGFPPLEAAACGTPVIVGMNSSFPEVMGNACLYVNPYNSVQIASAMEALLSDDKLRAELVSAGLARAKMFSWENSARELFEIFQSLKINS